MPRIPTYQPNQVRPVEAVDTRFRAADNNGGMLGALGSGLQKLGVALDKYATVEDGIQDSYDQIYARTLALEYQAAQAPVLTQYGVQQGKGAIDQAAPTQEQLTKLRDDTLAKASNPRMKRYLEERLAEPFTKAMSTVTGHSLQQQVVMAENTALSERGMAIDEAAGSFADPKLFDAAKGRALAANAELGRIKGWDAAQAKAENLSLTTKIHQGAVDVMLSQTDPDLDLVATYVAAHKDEMTSSAYAGVLKDLQKPFQEREAENDFRSALMGMPSGAAPAPAGDTKDGYDPARLKTKIRGPETGGDDNARNRLGSSASGRYQFVEGTFKDIWGKVYGAGADEAWRTKRFDPAVQEKLMDRLMADNKKALAGVAPVTDGNMYVMHVLGSGDGPKLLKASGDTPVANLLSAEIIRKNPSYFGGGKTVSQSLAIIRGKVGGADGSDPEAPRAWDKDAVYNAIDAMAEKQKWSFERTERAKRRADKVISTDESLLKRQEDAADKSAAEIILAKGANFKSKNMIPAEVWAKMSIGARASAEAAIERNNAPKAAAPNGPMAMTLNQMKILQPEAFANFNLATVVGQVSQAELDTLLTEQTRMKRDNGDTVKRRSGINTTVETMSRFGQVKLDDMDRAAIGSIMEGLEVAAIAAGKPVDRAALYRQALQISMAMPRPRAEK